MFAVSPALVLCCPCHAHSRRLSCGHVKDAVEVPNKTDHLHTCTALPTMTFDTRSQNLSFECSTPASVLDCARILSHLHGHLYRQKFRRLLNQGSGFFHDLVQIALRDSIFFLRVCNCMSACGDESPEVRGANFRVLHRLLNICRHSSRQHPLGPWQGDPADVFQ